MAKNTFRTPPPEENSNLNPNLFQSSWKTFGIFNRRHPIFQYIASLFIKFVIYFISITLAWVLVLKFVPIWVTPTMIDRKVTALFNGRDSEIHSDWEPYENISKEAALAVVASEDQLFPQHFGFDFNAMWGAFRYNLKGKKIKGASTISQQVAKNVFLWQGRSYVRKVLEVYFTFLIEIVWGKQRILEVYLNVAEMGKMTFGVEAASLRYYGHSAKSITRTEAARIAAVLPSPNKFSITNPSKYVQRRTSFITRQMRGLGGKAYIADL
ncbi:MULTISPECIES: monofunctional biosynthetic peptidoglycan transglycosylase [unclassified Arcicella]|uniref:monofunctional biosynthetic peptidoglycan transglycosylase n=1 Tax=unclassified Arcicella TaxID=2644986 RepID=UPI00285436DA|nr:MULTISPECIES: monofunctional biosynthetic peptidoglycan transglycosylase [unclassified Arcicella]MDR6564782.1 monofunctional biosynthetic peptidoglycan transglycosylase [Arcicella sp. BE51]MDR6814578.1 monofunctional biosynthetic peptidoglycan transglycosylase [Arcicella sp. BE140]MDR6825956.1 monofunctional biosynthetic peptidoglycan transglycosylase [Arcicella sp. BE139]